MSLLSSIANVALKPSVAIGNLITAGLEKVTGNVYGRTTSKELASTKSGVVLGTAIAGTAVALTVATGTASSVAKSVSSKVAATAVTHPIQTAAAALVGAPLVAGILTKKPELITELPKKSFSAGQGIVDVVSEHPVAAGIVGSVTGGVAAYEIGKAILGKDKTTVEVLPAQTSTLPTTTNQEQIINPSQNIPTTPETVSLTTPKRRRRAKVKTSPIFRNNIHINIVNKPVGAQNRRYLNQVIYAK